MQPSVGRFLPEDDMSHARPFVVLGSKVRSELFATENPLGKRIRIGSESCQIIGIMESKGQMLETLSSILNVLTLAVGVLGAISLLVGGIGILTIMTIAITECTPEIGLLRAVGARRREILTQFISEATVLATIGGSVGLVLGAGGAWLLEVAIPALPTHTPWGYAVVAELVAAAIGLAAGVAPAYKAANLDPVAALRAE